MTKELFEDAQFGDEFIRRDGKTARYCGRANIKKKFSNPILLECDGIVSLYTERGYYEAGFLFDQDIIQRKEENNENN